MPPRTIPAAVRQQQTAASDPAASVFVSANAGAGKTHVLAQRVIRLMLDGGPDGVDPSKILCITFTKAAAANMATRVYDRLKAWVALDDEALDAAIRELGVTHVDATKRQRARRLFAAALETPGGLKVQTIHAFCTRVLQQFPFEAGVAAHFTVLEDRTQNEMLHRARMAVLLEAAAAPGKPLGRALAVLTEAAADVTLVKVIDEAVAERAKFAAWIDGGEGSRERAVAQLCAALGVGVSDGLARIEKEIVEGPHLPMSQWADVAAVFETGSKQDQEQTGRLSAALAASGGERIERYFDIFLTGDREPRKKLITKGLADDEPVLAQNIANEQDRIIRLRDRRNGVICRDRTAALAAIAADVIRRYTQEKERRGLLDYDDLIDRTHRLLAQCDPNWVHHKLDSGLDHVLIDEAQDTSEKQWDIVKQLVSEFGAGAGAGEPRPRTVFAVGDEKQSIFSFQGAAPREYDAARRHFERRFEGPDVTWRFVRFDHSFRSGENVLGAVDAVFREPAVHLSITSGACGPPEHKALPDAAPGLVEIWPLIAPDPAPDVTAWEAPFDDLSETSPQVRLAGRIAAAVRGFIDGRTPVGRERRPMRCGDVLILVRQRGPLFGAVIRALKNAGVAVAGADRLVLTEHIAVTDLMALADALLLPHDDLALAVALKSPLFGLDDGHLFKLAHGRRGSLRKALRERAHEDVEEGSEAGKDAGTEQRAAFAAADALLDACAERARSESPFAFFAWLLGPQQGRQKIYARLGLEAADALDEFLELALTYESAEPPSLQGFVAWLRSAATEVKRDMETARDEVRVMTVHGAKGLEAPVVIIADTTTPPRGSHAPALIDIGETGIAVPPAKSSAGGAAAPPCMVWAPRKEDDVEAVAQAREAVLDEAEHEHRRLLYVALTRAAEHLIVCGFRGKNKPGNGCWYNLILAGLEGEQGFEEVAGGDTKLWRYRKNAAPSAAFSDPAIVSPSAPSSGGEGAGSGEPQRLALTNQPSVEGLSSGESALPSWLTTPVPAIARAALVSPSSAIPEAAHERRTAAAEQAQAQALARGTLIHRLLQSLPDVEPSRREAAAHGFLARAAAQFSEDERTLFAGRVLAILADRRFDALFSPGSRAEVPIVGRLARAGGGTLHVSGQIDRLAVTGDEVLIADYKTNRDPPDTVDGAPDTYVGQLALYRAMLGRMYPGRPIRCALVWTEIPALMELPASMLDAAATRIVRG
jgi:ATP-dependent helicase/nuclease subunit A